MEAREYDYPHLPDLPDQLITTVTTLKSPNVTISEIGGVLVQVII